MQIHNVDEQGEKITKNSQNYTFILSSVTGDFHETGFTLITLENEPITKDWRTNLRHENPDIKYFMEEMEPHIKKLYPNTKKLMWTHNVVRGGDRYLCILC